MNKKIKISVPVIKYQTWEIEYINFPEDSKAGENLAKLFPLHEDTDK